ncbi:hypothetical protein [Butyrivibrio hungatei]|uniref:Uncharacterized protein n=1 Tax=Butyrivibrio hungatei TaxID=185008 RepID=A0A1D9P612_9FIRM|nr:hypothetical protein [Butyrivibrio hungatei]AOZ97943.1 hypothetical protein bhn_II144 [Butyrivibrio hungatei]
MNNAVINTDIIDEVLNMWTSPVIEKEDGTESIVVHVSVPDGESSKLCGIQLPEFHLVYNNGFVKEDFKEILELIDSEYDSLWFEAENTEPDNERKDDLVLSCLV